jgi:hypothetical protein
MSTSETKNLLDNEDNEKVVEPLEIDPLKLREVSLNNDVYTLYWAALNKKCWEKLNTDESNKLGFDLYLTDGNKCSMIAHFILFVITVFFALTLIIYQVFTTKVEVIVPVQITVIRILLVLLCQVNLMKEFRESVAKLKYTAQFSDEFSNACLAGFIASIQFIVACASYVALLLFICTESAPLDLIMDFTGIVIFVDLDDWIGSKICSIEPIFDEEVKYYTPEKYNHKLPLYEKLSKIQYYTDIVEDRNYSAFNCLTTLFGPCKFILIFPPLLVLLIEMLFVQYHPKVAKPHLDRF